MVQQGAERPALAGLVREAVEFPSRRREQLPERALQFAMRRRERRVPMIGIETGVVLFQPRPVQPVKPRDAPGPAPLPLRRRLVAGRALDEIPARMRPTERERHKPRRVLGQFLVGAVPVANQDRARGGVAEQPRRRRGAARGIDMEADRVLADPDPQPRAARPAGLAERPDAPGRLVAPAQPRLVPAREDGRRERLEQRREAPRAVGRRPRRDRQPLAGQPVGDPVEGPKTRIALAREPRPHAGPAGRVREQARHRRRRDFRRRGGAIAASAPARARDHARVRP